MTTSKLIISILIMAAITFGTRLAPFVIFGRGEKSPSLYASLRRKNSGREPTVLSSRIRGLA